MAVSSLGLGEDTLPSNGPICPVCFRDYSDNEANLIPRILQCGHTYCTECLDRLLNTAPDEDDFEQVVLQIRYGGREWTTVRRQPLLSRTFTSNELKCPTCNSMNYITNRDVSGLTKNFALLGCRPTNQNPPRRQASKHFCSEHSHEKRVYCRDCRDLVCAYCQLYGEHKNHDCAIASDAAQPSVEALKVAMETVSTHLRELNSGQKAVKKAEKKLKKNRYQCERQVKGYFDQLIRLLEAKRNTLLRSVGTWTDEQMYILNAQLQSLASGISDSETIQKTCDTLIKGDPLDALSQQDDVIQEVTHLQTRVKALDLRPLINPWIKCEVTGASDSVLADLLKNCQLSYDTELQSDLGSSSSDVERDYESFSDDEISTLSDVKDDNERHVRLAQDGAGASASPAVKGKKKYYQETQQWLEPLDSPEPSLWPGGAVKSKGSSAQAAYPSPPNNSFLSSTEMPTSQASDQNTMFLNPISTKAKYTNLLRMRPPRLTTFSDPDSNSDDDQDVPITSYEPAGSTTSESEDEHGGSYCLEYRPPRDVFRRLHSTSIGECSASPDEGDDEREEPHTTTGEIYSLHPDGDPLPMDSIHDLSSQDDDFTYAHHLTMLPGNSSQGNEIVIPVGHPYSSWSASLPLRRSSSRPHSVSVNVATVDREASQNQENDDMADQ